MSEDIRRFYHDVSEFYKERFSLELHEILDIEYYTPTSLDVSDYHSHDEYWQLWYVLDGTAQVNIAGIVLDATPGDIFLIKPGTCHTIHTYARTTCHMFDVKAVLTRLDGMGHHLKGGDHIRLHDGSGEAQFLVKGILNEIAAKRSAWKSVVENQVTELFIWVVRKVHERNQVLSARTGRIGFHSAVCAQVIEYLEGRYHEDLKLSDVAEHVHLSPSYLSGVFKKVTGRTVIEYLTKLRLERAKHLLMYSELEVSEIAAAVGYRNHSYFDRVFRSKLDISPSDYRATGHEVNRSIE